MTYQLKNLLLSKIGDWAVHKDTLQAVKDSLPMITDFYSAKGYDDPEPMPIRELIKEPIKEVYTCPIFSEAFCKIVRDEIENIKSVTSFTPNVDEDELRQIPEFILSEKCPEFYESLSKVVLSVMNPIFWSLWQTTIDDIHVQLANYNPKGKVKGAWHHDHSSDITVVVPLNTGDYKGGGTEFFGRGIVPPLSNGSGLIFPGFTHLHRGLAVESGDRYLMVFWLKRGSHEE